MILNISDTDIVVYYILQGELKNNDIAYVSDISYIDTECNLTYTDKMNDALKLAKEQAYATLNYMEQAYGVYNMTVKRRVAVSFEDELSYSGISDSMPSNSRIDISLVVNEPTLISTWDELSKVPPTHMFSIDIDNPNDCNGHIVNIDNTNTRFNYLSTHTFYGGKYKEYLASSKRLQRCGFNIILDNWDKDVDEDIEPSDIILSNVNLCVSPIPLDTPIINYSVGMGREIASKISKSNKSFNHDNSRRQFNWRYNMNYNK